MALFKIFKGSETAKLIDSNATGYRVPTDGYAYYDTSTKLFYIDADYDGNGTIKRYPINAAGAWRLKNYNRLTDANIAHITDGGMELFQATATMTDNKPDGNGQILHFHWDTSSSWDSQLFIPDGHGGSMQWRAHTNATDWGDGWKTLLDSDNYTTYTVKKDGTGAFGTWGISITGNAASATYATNVRVTETNPSSATTYYPNFTAGVAANTNYVLRGTKHYYLYDAGTAATGVYLNIGAANYKGGLTLHTNSSYYGDIAPTTLTANRTFTLPDKTGTFALMNDIAWSSIGSALPDAAELNNYNKTHNSLGLYYSGSSAKTATLSHPPFTGSGFRFISFAGYGDTRGHQIAWGTSATPYLRTETGTANTYTAWSKLVYIQNDSNNANVAIGSSSQPVYTNSDGKLIAATAYSDLLTSFTSSTNTLSITVGGTTKTASAINSVSNTWTAGTTAGPTIKTTVNGVTGTAVAIPSASKTASGIVTTGDQYFNGTKGFGYMARYGRTNTGAATRWVADTWLYNDAGTQVGEFWYDCGDATNITTGQYVWSQYSPNSTANTSTTGKKENYKLPVVTSGLTETKNYTIITTKNPADLGYYLPLTGGTLTGNLTISKTSSSTLVLKNTTIDTTAASISAAQYNSLYFEDKNNYINAFVQGFQATDGHTEVHLAARRRNTANDNNVQNLLKLLIAADGTQTVSVSSPAAWRTGLGLGSLATKNGLAWNEITQSGANSLPDGNSDFTDNTELLTSYASNNGFADTNAPGKVYKRDAICMYNYVKTKASGTWGISISGNAATATKATQDGSGNTITSTYVKKAGDTMSGNLIVSKTGDTYVEAKNTTTGCRIEIDVNDAGQHGLWSSGYYANSTYTASSKWILYRSTDGEAHTGLKLYGAVWNDYAEYRKDNPNETQEPGRCIKELGDGSLALTTKRLERGCEIVSDTFGFAIGQDEENGYNTPIASNGRVLAYPYESIEEFRTHIGWPVCSGPNGTVSIMTEEEEEKYPSRIIGTISEIPTYKEWGTGKVKVDGRIWIRIR